MEPLPQLKKHRVRARIAWRMDLDFLHDKLGNIRGAGLVQLATELGICIDDGRNALCGVKPSDLNKVLA